MSTLLDDLNGKRGETWRKEAERILIKFNDAYIDSQGVIRWKENNSVPPDDLLELWHYAGLKFDFDKAIEVGIKEKSKLTAVYRERMRNYKYSEDEMVEIRVSSNEIRPYLNM